jgi:hypothetical protein
MNFVRSMSLAALGLGVVGMAVGSGCGGGAVAGTDGGMGAAGATGSGGGSGSGSGGTTGKSGTGGSSGKGSGGSSGKGSGGSSGTGMTIVPPGAPSGPKTTSTSALNFAVHSLNLGDLNPKTGMPGDSTAWQSIGYNIDGLITTATSTNVCTIPMNKTPCSTAACPTQADGNGGIDNSFGGNLYDGLLVASVDMMASTTINTDINAGKFTLMFDVTGLDSTATQTATGLTAQAFAGGAFPGTPSFTAKDNWPILGGSGLLSNMTAPFKSKIQFTDSYIVNGTWVSGSPTTIPLSLEFAGVTLTLDIIGAQVTFDHSMPNHAANGVISGAIDTTQLLTAIASIAGHVDPSLCSGSTLKTVEQTIEKFSDIVVNGTAVSNKAGTTCNAISVGISFTADVIGQPKEIAPASCIKPNPCGGDAGVPDGGMLCPVDAGPG